ncbi:MAG: IS66 family transposase, partial [Planctomycetota bacterium]|nr:IS66 family transposase [Planctomycetota bacterium]
MLDESNQIDAPVSQRSGNAYTHCPDIESPSKDGTVPEVTSRILPGRNSTKASIFRANEITWKFCQACELKRAYEEVYGRSVYWETMHARAVERENKLKQENEELKAKVRLREHQLFGRKAEQKKASDKKTTEKGDKRKRSRGQQPGNKGHGRRKQNQLPVEEQIVDLPEQEKACPRCGLPYEEFPETEDSEVIEVEVKAHRRKIRRKRYKPACRCPDCAGIITAPAPGKVIHKGILGVSAWVQLILDKFLYYRPTCRLLEEWQSYGLYLSPGTVTGGMKKIADLFAPVESEIVAQHYREERWHADETRWMVFSTTEGKVGYRWYLWVFQSDVTVVYKLDPTRSAKVPQEMLKGVDQGILIVDRYSAYKVLLKDGKILIAFCWVHVRRDFLNLARNRPLLESWAMEWVEAIGQIYFYNKQRLKADTIEDFDKAHETLCAAIRRMRTKRDKQLKDPNLHPACRKVLKSLKAHWKGLTLFVKYGEVPMDNNEAERRMRGPAVARKNYYGSGAVWSGHFAARMFSILQTLRLGELNPRLWLTAYLQCCADRGGTAPEDLTPFLPWKMSDEQRAAFQLHPL